MAHTNRYSGLARPDLLLTEYRLHNHSTEKGRLFEQKKKGRLKLL